MSKNKLNSKIVFHVDLDAFFASCEERESPHFVGKPIVVGSEPKQGKGRGVVSTANYEARKYGIHSAMPISQAWRLCPNAIFLPVNGRLYSRVSRSIMAILQDFSAKYNGEFEQVGIDEAYIELDLKSFVGILDPQKTKLFMGHIHNLWNNSPARLAKEIKKSVKAKEKITASVGAAPNKLIAKIASDFQKPDGLTVVKPNDVQKFLDPLPIRKLPGIGPKTEKELRKLYMGRRTSHIEFISDLQKISQATLYEYFGEHGLYLYESARGIDHSTISKNRETKSISQEHTFEYDTSSAQEILPVLFNLINEVLKSSSRQAYKNFKTITLKIRYADFKTHTKSKSQKYNTINKNYIETEALRLLWPFLTKKIRLIGFRISNFK